MGASYGAAAASLAAGSSVAPSPAIHVRGHGDMDVGIGGTDGAGDTDTDDLPTATTDVAGKMPVTTGIVWEFETDSSFAPFSNDDQTYVEQHYQKYLAGGSEWTNVEANGFTISLNFAKMTQ